MDIKQTGIKNDEAVQLMLFPALFAIALQEDGCAGREYRGNLFTGLVAGPLIARSLM